MEKNDYRARFKKMLTIKLKLMGLNILSDTFKATKMAFVVGASHVSLLIAIAAFGLEMYENLPSEQITELIVEFVLFFRLGTYLASMVAKNLKWKALVDRIDCERKSWNANKDAKELSLNYNKTDFICEFFVNAVATTVVVIVLSGNAVIKTNEYRLPINCYLTFLPIDDSPTNWALNYLFHSISIYCGALVFYSFCSLVLVVLNHSCWGIDMVKLLIKQLNSTVGDDETPFDSSQKEKIAKQISSIYEMHVQALQWNEDVRDITQLIFFFEFSATSVLICLSIFSIYDEPFNAINVLVCLIILLFQLFVFCWMGHRVLVKIDELTAAIYDIKWYSLDKSHSKSIQIILRSTQNMEGFDGILKPVSMETFQQVLESSYSLLTFLKSFN